jgi:hypothetical protein
MHVKNRRITSRAVAGVKSAAYLKAVFQNTKFQLLQEQEQEQG